MLDDIKKAIDAATEWTRLPDKHPEPEGSIVSYEARNDGWILLAVGWTSRQGMYWTTGFDGAATRKGTIVRLPRELAELAFKKASGDAAGSK